MSRDGVADLPLPFYDDWAPDLQPAAHALWDWHLSLADAPALAANGTPAKHDAFFDEEHDRALRGEPLRIIREAVWRPAYQVCAEHDLSRSLLAAQIDAVRVLRGRVRFDSTTALNDFIRRWVTSLAQLLAGLVDADHDWQRPRIAELAKGFFIAGHLFHLPRDLAEDRLFIPTDDLERAGVTVDQLRRGTVDEAMQRLLWKQSVRVRDALAQGQPLIDELSWRYRYALKRYWLGALELLTELKRRDYDLWRGPVELSWFQRLQIHLQTFLGRATAR
jgi:phytoene synthase